MNSIYIALGINSGGTILVLRPFVNGRWIYPVSMMMCDLKVRSVAEASGLIGQMLVSALGAFEPLVDGYPVLPPPPTVISFPTNPPKNEPLGDMRKQRMTISLGANAAGPALVLLACNGDEPISDPRLQSLEQLAKLGPLRAVLSIGDCMLRGLAVMHPGTLPWPELDLSA